MDEVSCPRNLLTPHDRLIEGLPARSRVRSRSVANLNLTRSCTDRAAELPPNRKPSSLLAHLLEDLLVNGTAQADEPVMNPLVQDWFEREPTTTTLGPHEDSECSRDGQPAISRGRTAIALVNQQERCSVLGSEGDPPLPDV